MSLAETLLDQGQSGLFPSSPLTGPTITWISGRLYLVEVTNFTGGGEISDVDIDGNAATLIGNDASTGGNNFGGSAWEWRPGSSGSGDVVFTFPSGSVSVVWRVTEVTGHNNTTPVVASATVTGNSNSPGSTISDTMPARSASGNMRRFLIADGQGGDNSGTPTTNWAELADTSGGGQHWFYVQRSDNTTDTDPSVALNGTPNAGVAWVGYEIVEDAGGGPTFDTFSHEEPVRRQVARPRSLEQYAALPALFSDLPGVSVEHRRRTAPKTARAVDQWVLDRLEPALSVIAADSAPQAPRRQVFRPQEPQVVLTALSEGALATIATESTLPLRRSQKPRPAPASDFAPVVEQGLAVIAAEDQSWRPRRRLPPKPPEEGNLGAIAALALPHDSPVRRLTRPRRQAPQDRPVSAVAGPGLLSFVTDTPVIQRRKVRRTTYIVDGPYLELIEVVPTYPDIVIELGTIHTFGEGITEFRFTEPPQEHGFAQQQPTVFKFVRKLF